MLQVAHQSDSVQTQINTAICEIEKTFILDMHWILKKRFMDVVVELNLNSGACNRKVRNYNQSHFNIF